jgi:hypothetical protein
MTAGSPNPASVSPLRWFHFVLLIFLLFIGASARWYRIGKESLTIDEYWALYLATGRGEEVFHLPYGVIVDSPPKVGFAGAPHWWHIWTGLSTTTHPPLYHLGLRWWVDLFGESDRAVRAMSWLFGIGAAAVLFDAVRRTAGPWRGLAAAGFMTFAPVQIDFSQAARPYTMLIFLGLILCDALIAIDRRGLSGWKLAVVGCATGALALTHYFSLGAILGAAVFVMTRRGAHWRKPAILAMAAGLLVALAVWGPVFWKTRHLYDAYQNFWRDSDAGMLQSARAIVRIPIRLLLDPWQGWRWFTAVPLAMLVFAVPPFRLRKSPGIMLWWLWTIGTIAVIAIVDLVHHSTMVGVLRYVFLASPAVYAILATIIPGRLGGIAAAAMVLCAAVYGASRVQAGPEPGEDWNFMAHLIEQHVSEHDVVALIGYYEHEPAYDYFVIAHYAGDWKRPVIFLMGPPDEPARRQLASRQRVWMVGHAARSETARLLPGWGVGAAYGVGRRNALWLLVPPPLASEPR